MSSYNFNRNDEKFLIAANIETGKVHLAKFINTQDNLRCIQLLHVNRIN